MTAAPAQIQRGAVRVACADDHPPVCEAIGRALDPARFVFAGAVTEVGGLDWLLERVEPAVLLLDVNMPGGEQPLQWLARSAGMYPQTRFVVYSAFVDRQLIDEAMDAGAWGYLVKSDDPALLSDLLERVLEGEVVLSESARKLA